MQRGLSKWRSTSLVGFRMPYAVLRWQSLLSTKPSRNHDDKEWNDAWETAWLPEDSSSSSSSSCAPAPWDSDLLESDANNHLALDDPDAKAFVEDMNANWDHRRSSTTNNKHSNTRDDYRLKKQRIHASLWSHQIHLLNEAKLRDADADADANDDIDKLLHSCSQIFESGGDVDANLNAYAPNPKTKPDGWETTSTSDDTSTVWDMSQREEDILLQEFQRRLAFSKFQIASFIKTHIFSRRRPIDGWKYMIEVIGPNARKGKGSVSRFPTLADPATQPFTEDRTPATRARHNSRKPR